MNNNDNNNLTENSISQPNYAKPDEKISGASFTFSIFAYLVLTLIFGLLFSKVVDKTQDWYIYLSYCVAPIALACVFFGFLKTQKLSITSCGFKKCHWKYYIFAIVVVLGLILSLSWVNDVFINLLGKICGYKQPQSAVLDLNLNGARILLAFLFIGVLPAFSEEIIFRGMIFEGAKKMGAVLSIVFTGLLFSIYHASPAQTVYQFICGALFALLAYRSKSVFPSMIAHFLNNSLVLFFYWLGIESFHWSIQVIAGLVLVGCVVYLIFFDKKELEEGVETLEIKHSTVKFLKASAIGIFACLVLWIAMLITYSAG